jgi:hypothetical protein
MGFGRTDRLPSARTRGTLCGVRRLAPLIAALALSLAAPGAAQAAPIVGIADQQPQMFANPWYRALDTSISRLVVSYDAVLSNTFEVGYIDAWLSEAGKGGVEPLVSFNQSRACWTGERIKKVRRCRLPSVKRYRTAVRAFRARYPDVDVYQPWNEINHSSQPTDKRPKRAAQFYNALRKECRGCKIVAADLLDEKDAVDYLKRFKRHAVGRPRLWGLHNYGDTNQHRSSRTRMLLRATKGEVWLTETGGIVQLGDKYPYSLRRARRSVAWMFKLARMSPRITRLYIYHWTGQERNVRFDAGLTYADGSPRPAYEVVRDYLAKSNPKPPGEPPPPPPPPPPGEEPPPPPPPEEEPNCIVTPLICPSL